MEDIVLGRIQVVGVYPLQETSEAYLIEVIVQASADEFDMGQFMQAMPGKPQNYWQVAYDEQYLNPGGDQVIGSTWHKPQTGLWTTRVAFFLHFVDFSLPMQTPFEPVILPQPTTMPDRLALLITYTEPD
jgi:hypothetical protein